MLLLIWGLDLTLTLTFSLALFPCVLLVLGKSVGVGLIGFLGFCRFFVFLGGRWSLVVDCVAGFRAFSCIIRLDIMQDKAEFAVKPAIYLGL